MTHHAELPVHDDDQIGLEFAQVAKSCKMLRHVTFLKAQMQKLDIPERDEKHITRSLDQFRRVLERPKLSEVHLITTFRTCCSGSYDDDGEYLSVRHGFVRARAHRTAAWHYALLAWRAMLAMMDEFIAWTKPVQDAEYWIQYVEETRLDIERETLHADRRLRDSPLPSPTSSPPTSAV
eukprot:m.292992 g.292992  ORF g.292992 m.292992 type:complete len:179 (+) comp17900_c0_seq1:89-625(+)